MLMLLAPGNGLAALDRWQHYTVTTIDRFHCTSNVWAREWAGCLRQVAALHSDHYRQVPLYIECLGQGMGWLP